MALILKVFLSVFLAYLVHHYIKVRYITGLFVYRHNHQPGPCRIIPGIEYGSEDIQTLPNGVALITAGLKAEMTNASAEHKGIYIFDFNEPHKNLTKLTWSGNLDEKDFTPHGISIWTDIYTGDLTVFVVNHGCFIDSESVEVFKYDERRQTIHHLRSIRDVHFVRINDIVATSNNTFYATNDDLWIKGHWRWKVTPFLQTRLGNVIFYDGRSAEPVASSYVLPNGINISPDLRTLYVMLYGEAQMVVFQRQSDNSLTEIKRVNLYMTRPDNVDVQSNGDLWIAGGYKLLANDDKTPPSSMVLQGKEMGGEYTFSEVYVNDGSVIDSASVVSYHNNQMLIGTPFSKLLYCKVNTEL